MKVIKIVVDELPENCSKCWFVAHVDIDFEDRYWCEGINSKFNTINDATARPLWCPLEVDNDPQS